jgi:Peptidase family M1 domain/TPR repeat
MKQARRPLGRAVLVVFALIAGLFLSLHLAAAPEKAKIQIDDYVIDAAVDPATHHLSAHAKVHFTALEDLSVAVFTLNNGLKPTKVTDDQGHTLSAERVTQDSTVRVMFPNGMTKGQSATLEFEYEGALISVEDSPVQGLKLAYIGDPVSYLLYPGAWFPMTSYGTDRFSSVINVSVPEGYTVIGSGGATPAGTVTSAIKPVEAAPEEKAPALTRRTKEAEKPAEAKRKTTTRRRTTKSAAKSEEKTAESVPTQIPGGQKFTFAWTKASFPGSIFIGKYVHQQFSEAGATIHVYFLPDKQKLASTYADTASREMSYFTTIYGIPPSPTLKIVEIPDDTVPVAWAPQIAALSTRAISEKVNYRLLANTIAHQWFGVDVSPATENDWWIMDGGARYSEERYVEFAAGKAGGEEVVKDMSVGALAYESVPLGQVATLSPFDPVFQSLVTDKGGMIFHMLRYVVNENNFDKIMRTFFQEYAGKSVTTADLKAVCEKVTGQQMTWFFSQWLDSTGAPEFKNKYTIYRIAKGFRVVGEISQDLDLFRMPVQLKIETDGKTEQKTIDVVGTNSSYSVETFGRPRKITIDPNDHVLKNSPDLQLRTAIMRGQQLVAQGNLAEALREFQKALDVNRNSSLAHYRIAEVFYLQHNYQAAANSYRDSLNGDGDPKWTEVWSHIQLGKIFDITGQRERAVNEYRQALQTGDNTQGALDQARQYIQKPFEREERSGD